MNFLYSIYSYFAYILIGLFLIISFFVVLLILENKKDNKINNNNISLENTEKEIKKDEIPKKYFGLINIFNNENKYSFSFQTNDGNIIGYGHQYKSKGSCFNGIYSLQKHLNSEILENDNKQINKFGKTFYEIIFIHNKYKFILTCNNSLILFESIEFESKDECCLAMENFKKISKENNIINSIH